MRGRLSMGEIPAWPVEQLTPPYRTNEIKRPFPLDRLIADVTAAWPWPYSGEEIDAIGSMVPENARQRTIEDVVRIGRRAVITLRLRKDHPDEKPRKPNLKAEIDRLKSAVAELTAAAESMSPAAWQLVATKASPYGPFRSMAPAMAAIYALRADDIHSGDAPGATDGRPPSDLLGPVILEFDHAFIAAHGGKRPRRRGPDFRIACLNPLGFCPAKGGFTEADTKMLESQMQKARKKT